METTLEARRLENEGKWRDAAKLWRSIGRHDDAYTCLSIAEATEKGDEFRELVSIEIGDEPELTQCTVNEWREWHKNLNEIYNRTFNKQKS